MTEAQDNERRRLQNLIKCDEVTLGKTQRRFEAAVEKITKRMGERQAQLEELGAP